jgi:putative radical SAM enzyme (TIGR03279 family)
MTNSGIEIETITGKSMAEAAGLLPGDKLLSINNRKVRDSIDLMFHAGDPQMLLKIRRGDALINVKLTSEGDYSDIGIRLKSFKVRKCSNRCIFCFVMQLPKGLRKALYLKDEDYRMSFLYGNYVTLTDLTLEDRKRIVHQRLSPLYISVHSTDTHVRNVMLGNPNAADIMKDLKYFASHKIRMHTQIVLCPGYNDGKELRRTLNDLYKFYPYVQSVAVVPVGLTEHRKKELRPVDADAARAAIETVKSFQTRFKRRHGEHIVFAADELYIKAGAELPPLEQYDELSQIENGVGLIPLFMAEVRKLKMQLPEKLKKKRFVLFTGVSFYPFLLKFTEKLKKKGIDIEVLGVENLFFGRSVTVTGLLTGRDVLNALSGNVHKDDILLIPDIVMKEGHEVFLDNVSRQDVEDILGVKSVIIESTPKGLVEAIIKNVC